MPPTDGQLILIVGLGNPGTRYALTRHNVGWRILDSFRERAELNARELESSTQPVSIGSWQEESDLLLSEIRIGNRRLVLLKPASYMNRSGEPLARIAGFYKVDVAALIVVHDEADIPLGTIRWKVGGSDGGHNGLRSVSAALGSRDYVRLRLGVGRPLTESSEESLADWLLSPFSREEEQYVAEAVERAADSIWVYLQHGLSEVQRRFNS